MHSVFLKTGSCWLVAVLLTGASPQERGSSPPEVEPVTEKVGSDSVRIPCSGLLFLEVEQIRIDYRSLNKDSVARKTDVILRLKQKSDSTHRTVWVGRFVTGKVDTVRLNPENVPMHVTAPNQKPVLRSWRRWTEPSLVFVTLSALVYLFYSVRSNE